MLQKENETLSALSPTASVQFPAIPAASHHPLLFSSAWNITNVFPTVAPVAKKNAIDDTESVSSKQRNKMREREKEQ